MMNALCCSGAVLSDNVIFALCKKTVLISGLYGHSLGGTETLLFILFTNTLLCTRHLNWPDLITFIDRSQCGVVVKTGKC